MCQNLHSHKHAPIRLNIPVVFKMIPYLAIYGDIFYLGNTQRLHMQQC